MPIEKVDEGIGVVSSRQSATRGGKARTRAFCERKSIGTWAANSPSLVSSWLCLLTRCRKRPQRASTCAYAKGIEKREEEKRKSELCFRLDLRDDDDATILILDKYPFQSVATPNELFLFHLSISNLSLFYREKRSRRDDSFYLSAEEARLEYP